MKRLMRPLFAVAGLVFGISVGDANAAPVDPTACLRVYVVDESGLAAPLPGVAVSLALQKDGSGCQCQAFTNAEGIATLSVAESGAYSISASLPGFEGKALENVVLLFGHPTAVNLSLRERFSLSNPVGPLISYRAGNGPPTVLPTATPTQIPQCCRPACP